MGRLDDETIVWLATVRPDGRPHLTPIWFVWFDERFWICTGRDAVKTRNVIENPRVALSLQSGTAPLVAEGRATVHARPYPAAVVDAFASRFDWDITQPDAEGSYDALWEITVDRWLFSRPD